MGSKGSDNNKLVTKIKTSTAGFLKTFQLYMIRIITHLIKLGSPLVRPSVHHIDPVAAQAWKDESVT